ncbi:MULTISPECIES: hypothetical protein [Proteus]|uniref:hypothetical protein n=1 Tax=Proteus TaxID=583 RepID=UPI00142E9D10|nr:hypothetical protein [Proteus columbae]MBG3018765.1 hypothetical protein [Proteus mirabilis]
MSEIFERLSYIHHPTSYFLWIPLPEEVRADKIVASLHQLQISVATAEPYATTTNIPHAIRIALASIDINLLRDALIKIREIIEYQIDL